MKKIINTVFFFAIASSTLISQDTLKIMYQENYPMCYKASNGEIKGIETEIIGEYVKWLKDKKKILLVVVYKNENNFDLLYSSVQKGSNNVIGAAMTTITEDRKKDVSFSPPYFKNVSVLAFNGNAPTIINNEEGIKTISKMNAYTIKNSTHQKYVNEILKRNPLMKVTFTETQNLILDNINKDKNAFGYVDIISFWYYISKTPNYIKFQKQFNKENEFFGYFFPKNFKYENSLKEFFESGFGFTSTKTYNQILENYLGYEIINLVEMN